MVEAYIDDMVVKSKRVSEHLEDLSEVFSVLRNINYVSMHLSALSVLARENFWGILLHIGG